MQRIALAAASLILLFLGLYIAASSCPATRTIEYVHCDPVARTCTTEVRTYRVGSVGAVYAGIVLTAFALGVLLILIANYARRMFMMALKALFASLSITTYSNHCVQKKLVSSQPYTSTCERIEEPNYLFSIKIKTRGVLWRQC